MSLVISKNSFTEYRILFPEKAIAAEKTAAFELKTHLEKVTGTAFPISSDTELIGRNAKRIYVGTGSMFTENFPGIDLKAIGQDGIVIKSKDGSLFLAGGKPRGTLYAVYAFLEDIVGVRWWTPGECYIPRKPDLEIDGPDISYVPPLQLREVFSRAFNRLDENTDASQDGRHGQGNAKNGNQMNEIFAARNRLNGFFMDVPEEYGGSCHLLGGAHTFNIILPPEKYHRQHPEWYAETKGRRQPPEMLHQQLCLSNPDMKNEFLKRAIQWIGENSGTKYVSISQNDHPEYCTCKNCMEAIEKAGSVTDYFLAFINEIAEALKNTYPGIMVETLAYQWTRKPPVSTKPANNVIIRLCSIECSQNHRLTDAENEHFYNDLKGWGEVSKQIYIWNYTLNAHNLAIPHPYTDGTAENIKALIGNKVIGVFQQGDGFNFRGNFNELKSWVYAHLLWNPALNENELIQEFISGYYGKAAGHIREYWDLIQGAMKKSGEYYGCFFRSLESYYACYTRLLPQITAASWLDLEDLNRAAGIFDKALAAVKDEPEILERVKGCKIPLDAVWLQDYDSLQLISKVRNTDFGGPEDFDSAVKLFSETTANLQSNYHIEGNKMVEKGYIDFLKSKPVKLIQLHEGLPGELSLEITGMAFTKALSARPFFLHRSECVVIEKDDKSFRGNAAAVAIDSEPDDRLLAIVHNIPNFYYYRAGGKWSIDAFIRCELKKAEGIAFIIEIVDIKGDGRVYEKAVNAKDISDGAYHRFSLGEFELKDGMYIRFYVPSRDVVKKLYADRLLLSLQS